MMYLFFLLSLQNSHDSVLPTPYSGASFLPLLRLQLITLHLHKHMPRAVIHDDDGASQMRLILSRWTRVGQGLYFPYLGLYTLVWSKHNPTNKTCGETLIYCNQLNHNISTRKCLVAIAYSFTHPLSIWLQYSHIYCNNQSNHTPIEIFSGNRIFFFATTHVFSCNVAT